MDVHGESKSNNTKNLLEVSVLALKSRLLLESSQLSGMGDKACLSLVMFPEIDRSF